MKLSTRSTYGLRALIELAFAAGHGPVSASAIAKRQDLSVAYLEQLLHRLKKEGIVRSTRGPRGGYVLARAPGDVSMGDVVRVLDGDVVDGAVNGKGRLASRRRAGANGANAQLNRVRRHAQQIAETVSRTVHERLTQSLEAVTLQDLCDDVREQVGEPLDHRYVFHI